MKQTMNPDVYGLNKRVRCSVCGEMGWKLRKGKISHFRRQPKESIDSKGNAYIGWESVLVKECIYGWAGGTESLAPSVGISESTSLMPPYVLFGVPME